jgi:hypothetical protein
LKFNGYDTTKALQSLKDNYMSELFLKAINKLREKDKKTTKA